jgi:hypothetical protein
MPSWIGCRVCFGTRAVVLFKPCDVESAEAAGGELITGGKENVGVGGKKGYIYSSSCDLIHILRFVG